MMLLHPTSLRHLFIPYTSRVTLDIFSYKNTHVSNSSSTPCANKSIGIPVYPVQVLVDAGVDAGTVGTGALNAPRHHPDEVPRVGARLLRQQGAAGVSLAGVFATSLDANAHHLGEHLLVVGVLALVLTPHRHLHLPQHLARRPSERGGTPADHHGERICKIVSWQRKASWLNKLAESCKTLHLEDSNIIFLRCGAVTFMRYNFIYIKIGWRVVSRSGEVVFTQSYLDVVSSKRCDAVGSRQHVAPRDESATAVLAVAPCRQQSCHEGPVLRVSRPATHDASVGVDEHVLVGVEAALLDG